MYTRGECIVNGREQGTPLSKGASGRLGSGNLGVTQGGEHKGARALLNCGKAAGRADCGNTAPSDEQPRGKSSKLTAAHYRTAKPGSLTNRCGHVRRIGVRLPTRGRKFRHRYIQLAAKGTPWAIRDTLIPRGFQQIGDYSEPSPHPLRSVGRQNHLGNQPVAPHPSRPGYRFIRSQSIDRR